MSWRSHFLVIAAIVFGALTLGYATVLIVDPYDAIGFSPSLERLPVADRRRFTTPSIARNSHFDSLILGTSTTMLLRPQQLDALFSSTFANLAMPSATPHEQLRLLALFAIGRGGIDNLIVGIDGAWCNTRSAPDFVDDDARIGFPEWMYDDSPWNDFPSLNKYLVQDTARQVAIVLGREEHASRADGYFEFPTERYGRYDPVKVHRKLRGEELSKFASIPASIISPAGRDPESWSFEDVVGLERALAQLPRHTRKILYLVPYHANILPDEQSLAGLAWRRCKGRLAQFGERIENLFVIDFMLQTELTQRDSNYWDPLHYTVEVATALGGMLEEAVRAPDPNSANYRVLSAP